MSAVSVSDEDGSEKKAAESSGTSLTAYGGPGIKLWRRKLRGRIGYRNRRYRNPNSRVTFASYAIDEKKRSYPKSSLLLKLQVPQVIDKSAEGAMIKRALLRLYVTDGSSKPFYYCKGRYGMPMNMNYKQFNVTYFNYLDDCRIAYARKVDEFVALDISDWMRDWVNGFGSRTIAILFDGGAPGKTVKADAVGFATPKADIAGQRPRLSLSCHGDRVEPLVVFKEQKVRLLQQRKKKKRPKRL